MIAHWGSIPKRFDPGLSDSYDEIQADEDAWSYEHLPYPGLTNLQGTILSL
jgi:hypothetical protein